MLFIFVSKIAFISHVHEILHNIKKKITSDGASQQGEGVYLHMYLVYLILNKHINVWNTLSDFLRDFVRASVDLW